MKSIVIVLSALALTACAVPGITSPKTPAQVEAAALQKLCAKNPDAVPACYAVNPLP